MTSKIGKLNNLEYKVTENETWLRAVVRREGGGVAELFGAAAVEFSLDEMNQWGEVNRGGATERYWPSKRRRRPPLNIAVPRSS